MTTLAYERGTVAKLHLGPAREDPAAHRRRARRRRSATARRDRRPGAAPAARARLPRGRAAEADLRPGDLGASCTAAAMGPEGSIAKLRVERGRAAPRRGRAATCSAPTRNAGTWGRDRVYSRALDDRRRHHPGEQEHPRPAHPRACRALSSTTADHAHLPQDVRAPRAWAAQGADNHTAIDSSTHAGEEAARDSALIRTSTGRRRSAGERSVGRTRSGAGPRARVHAAGRCRRPGSPR